VALALKGVGDLTTEQAANVAKLVRFRFGVPAENVIITDQSGRTLHDPTADEDGGRMSREFLAQAEDYERELAAKANRHLEQTFGARKALVTVTSQWNYDQSTIIDEKIDPETVALQVDTKETSTPLGSASGAGGVTGVSATAPSEFGNESAAVPTAPVAAGSAQTSKTKDQKTTYEASRSRTQTVRTVPRLERLFVSLTLDESLSARRAEIQKIVEAAVGFDSSRQDIIGVTTTAFAAPEVAADSTPSSQGNGTTAVEDEGPSAMTQLLIERGVEIAAAVAFLALLFTSLRGSRKEGGSELAGAATAATSGGGPGGDASIDPEALARAQIEELVRTDPRRVGEILSRWVDEKATAKV
jgi:flagellar biosynthesis/type III secretory pathway M-ring protein FliF/YscJ